MDRDVGTAPHTKVGFALVAAAGILSIVGSWLPWISTEIGFTDKTFTSNGFAEGEEGWWTAGIGVLLLIALLLDRMWRGRNRTALGVMVIAASLACGLITLTDYQETQQRGVPGSRRALLDALRESFEEQRPLETFDPDAAEELLGFRGGPGTGTWTLFLASGLGIIGGVLLVAARSQPQPHVAEDAEESREKQIESTKVCPRCAETVKAAAQVCRFCGHEFTA